MKKNKRLAIKGRVVNYLIIAVYGLCFFLSPYLYAEKIDSHSPERIVLNLAENPSTGQAVTWRTKASSRHPRAEVIQISEFMKQSTPPMVFSAVSTQITLDENKKVSHHSVVLNNLSPETAYAYRVGDDLAWSEWNQFTTASEHAKPFSFVYFGDIQKDVFSMGPLVFRSALQKIPEARFWLFVGDIVDNGPDDSLWDEFFLALGFIPRTLSLALLPGNHEYIDPRNQMPGTPRTIASLWRPQFTLPENGPKGLEELVYWFNYQGVCFIFLNRLENMEQQKSWLEAILSKNRQPWTVVAMHHPVYPLIDRDKDTTLMDTFVPVFDRFSVDLVLQGHHHSYARTKRLKNNEPVEEKEKGTVYIISNSGPKYYPAGGRYSRLMEKTMADGIFFQSIRFENRKLVYTAYNLNKDAVDHFVIEKD